MSYEFRIIGTRTKSHKFSRCFFGFFSQMSCADGLRGSSNIPPTWRSGYTNQPRSTVSPTVSRNRKSGGTVTAVPWTWPPASARPCCRTGRCCSWRRRRASATRTPARTGASPTTRSARPSAEKQTWSSHVSTYLYLPTPKSQLLIFYRTMYIPPVENV